MNQRNPITVADNIRGANLVTDEILKAIITALPNGPGLLRHALANTQLLRDAMLGSTQSEATLEGLDAQARYWQARLREIEALRTGP